LTGRALRVSGKRVVAALKRGGWDVVNIRGSHHHLRHPTRGGLVTVPVHGTTILEPKTLASILEQADLTDDELRELL
jgi:predicted RNA binding protein YcfA (HicA-like mRNA interferase family)